MATINLFDKLGSFLSTCDVMAYLSLCFILANNTWQFLVYVWCEDTLISLF